MSSPDTLHGFTRSATLNVVHPDYVPERDGELLRTGQVMALLNIARSTVTLYRQKGDLRGFRMRDRGQYRYPSRQPILERARAALQGQAS